MEMSSFVQIEMVQYVLTSIMKKKTTMSLTKSFMLR